MLTAAVIQSRANVGSAALESPSWRATGPGYGRLTGGEAPVSQPIFDKKDQLEKIQAGLLDGEEVFAVYDAIGAGTGFIGLTTKRVIIQDNSFVGKKVALTSIPYSRVNAVSFVSDKSMFGKFASSSTINVHAGGRDYEVQFRGEEKALHAHNLILSGQIKG
jgi:hypothetical protein